MTSATIAATGQISWNVADKILKAGERRLSGTHLINQSVSKYEAVVSPDEGIVIAQSDVLDQTGSSLYIAKERGTPGWFASFNLHIPRPMHGKPFNLVKWFGDKTSMEGFEDLDPKFGIPDAGQMIEAIGFPEVEGSTTNTIVGHYYGGLLKVLKQLELEAGKS